MLDKHSFGIRTFEIVAGARSADGTFPVTVSSDAPVEMPDGVEILKHTADAIDLSRAPLPIIVGHRGGQVNVGIIDNLETTDGRLRGRARFGARPEAAAYRSDVESGIIRSVSVGYIREKGFRNKDNQIVVTRWQPSHVALVAEPADVNAGFFRDLTQLPEFKLENEALNMDKDKEVIDPVVEPKTENRAADIEVIEPRKTESAVEMEKSRRRAIANMCATANLDQRYADMWIGQGLGLEEVSKDILAVLEERGKTNPQPASKLGLSNREAKQFSIVRAIRACSKENWNEAGYELECSRAVAQKLGKVPDPRKFYVPYDVMDVTKGQRDLSVGANGGTYLVSTNNIGFIDILRNRSVVLNMGGRELSGLVGNVSIPKQSAAATAYWLTAETTTITESQQTIVQLSLTPKNVGAYTEISRQLLLQSSPAAESIVTGDLAAVVARAVDSAAIAGTNANGQPQGIIGTSGLGATTATNVTLSKVLDFQQDLADANVMPNPATTGYVATPAVAKILMAAPPFTYSTNGLWTGNMWDGQLAGFRSMSSNQMPSANMLFGDFSECIIASWGVLEVEVNPYAGFTAGIIGVRAMYSIDIGVRYAGAFSLSTSVTAP